MFIKIRYTLNGKTQTIPLSVFIKSEDEFLSFPSKFSDGFIGYYHNNALETTDEPIEMIAPDGSIVIIKKVDGKYRVSYTVPK
jgi:hypothetical protein